MNQTSIHNTWIFFPWVFSFQRFTLKSPGKWSFAFLKISLKYYKDCYLKETIRQISSYRWFFETITDQQKCSSWQHTVVPISRSGLIQIPLILFLCLKWARNCEKLKPKWQWMTVMKQASQLWKKTTRDLTLELDKKLDN